MSAPAVKAVPPPAASQSPKVTSPGGPSASPGKLTQTGAVLSSLNPNKQNAVPNTNHSGILNLVAEHKNVIPPSAPSPLNATSEPQALTVVRPQEKEKDLSKDGAEKKEKEINKKPSNGVEAKDKPAPTGVATEGAGRSTTKADAETSLVNHTVAEASSTSSPAPQPAQPAPPTAPPPPPTTTTTSEQPATNSQSRTGSQSSASVNSTKKAEVTSVATATTTVPSKTTTAPSIVSSATTPAVNHSEPVTKPSPAVETPAASSSPSGKAKQTVEPKPSQPKPLPASSPAKTSSTTATAATVTAPPPPQQPTQKPEKAEKSEKAEKVTKEKETDDHSSPKKGVKRRREVKEPRQKDKGDVLALLSEERKPKRQRVQTQPYQAPLPELNFLFKTPEPSSKAQDDRLTVFYKGEFLAVRNAEGSFYICQALQNINKNSHRIRIRWLSQEEENNPNRDIYSPDFYDHTDFECILTSLNMERIDRNKYRLSNVENLRTKNILKRALDVESGTAEKPTPTEDNPDGLDVSLFKDEAQLKKRKPVKKKKGSPKRVISPRQITPTKPVEQTGTKATRLPPDQKKRNAVTEPIKDKEVDSSKQQKIFRSSRRGEPAVVDNVQKILKPKGTISQPKPAAILRGKEKQNIVPKGKKKAAGGKKA